MSISATWCLPVGLTTAIGGGGGGTIKEITGNIDYMGKLVQEATLGWQLYAALPPNFR